MAVTQNAKWFTVEMLSHLRNYVYRRALAVASHNNVSNARGPTLGEISYTLGEITEIKI